MLWCVPLLKLLEDSDWLDGKPKRFRHTVRGKVLVDAVRGGAAT